MLVIQMISYRMPAMSRRFINLWSWKIYSIVHTGTFLEIQQAPYQNQSYLIVEVSTIMKTKILVIIVYFCRENIVL